MLCFQFDGFAHLFVSRNIERYHFIKQDVAKVLPQSYNQLAGFSSHKIQLPQLYRGFQVGSISGRKPKANPFINGNAVNWMMNQTFTNGKWVEITIFHPFQNGCFNWMIPNLHIKHGCFHHFHPFKKGC